MAGIPKPFKRPSISISSGERQKIWRDTEARNLSAGDLVQWRGVVSSVTLLDKEVLVTFANGSLEHYQGGDIVHAFTADP